MDEPVIHVFCQREVQRIVEAAAVLDCESKGGSGKSPRARCGDQGEVVEEHVDSSLCRHSANAVSTYGFCKDTGYFVVNMVRGRERNPTRTVVPADRMYMA